MRRPILATVLITGLAASTGAAPPGPSRGRVTDPRDGQGYPTVTLAGIRWMARNLAYATERSHCYDDDPALCAVFGRLYRWEDALGACPAGWHLATEFEWQALEDAIGLPFSELESRGDRGTTEGAQLKIGGGTGFDVEYGGWWDFERRAYRARDRNAAFWTATEVDLERAWHRDIDIGDDMIYRSRVNKPYALSVRCVEDWLMEDAPPEEPGDDCWRVDNHVWWSPAGDRLVLYSACNRAEGAQIVTIDPDGANAATPFPNTGSNHSPEWSPEGSRIAFYSNAHAPNAEEPGGAFDIYTMNADGSDLRRLTRAPGRDGGPVWSPDGRRIAFYSFRDGNAEVYVMGADGSHPTRLTESEGHDFPMGWSAADDRLLVYSNQRGSFDIYTMKLDGTDVRWIAETPADEEMPAYSPDGSEIIYVWNDGVHSRLMIRALDGSAPRIVTESERWAFDQPAFSPDGQWIGYSVGNRGDEATERWWRTVILSRPDGSEARTLRGEIHD